MAINLRPTEIFPITTRFLQVIRTADVSPGMRRVTMGGEQLKAHTAENGYPVAEFRSDGFDDEFKVLIKHPDVDVAVGPAQLDGVLDWPRGDEHLLLRTYTVRRWDPEAGEIDVDFVNHGVGPATSWARNVQPGETIQIAGPKSSSAHPKDVDWVLVGADETALPAVARWLEEWPEGARGQFFIEVEEESHRQDLNVPQGVELTWLIRHGAEAGTTTLLFDALKAAEWWEGKVFAWVAGEAGTLTPIRRWLRREKDLDKEQIEVTGYWKKQKVVASADNPELPDLAAMENSREAFHELTEIMPGIALRVAATLGLGQVFGNSERSLAELVGSTGAVETGLFKLLRYLTALEVVERTQKGWRLTEIGRELDNDDTAEELNLDGALAKKELAVVQGFLGAIRDGEHANYQESDLLLQQRLEFENEYAAYVAGSLAADEVFENIQTLSIMGRGSKAFAQEIIDKHPAITVHIVGAGAEIKVLETGQTANERIKYVTGMNDSDAVLLLETANDRSDVEAIALLKEAARHGRILYFSKLLQPQRAHDHDSEHDLENFVLTGGGMRTAAELDQLFAAAGLNAVSSRTIGWGMTLYDLTIAPR